jgi:predicted secreted protein
MESALSCSRIRSFLSVLCLLILLVAFHPQMAFAATKVVTDADKGGDVEIKVRDTLEVRLASNPSTGYMWYVHPKSTAMLRPNGQSKADTTDQSAQPVEGRPIIQVFTFQPKRAGDGILLLRYVRSWEKPTLGEEQFTLHVIVDE